MENQQENSLRDDILAASEEVEGGEEERNEVEEAAAPETAQETETEVPGETSASEQPAAEPGDQLAEPAVDPEPLKPPVDWAPEVAALWGDLNPEVQNAIAERERNINDILSQSAGAREAVQSFETMFQPYVPLMQAEGVTDPLVAVNGLLQTTATLALGSPQQKAERIAGLIAHYGVDIQALDAILAGQPAQDPQAQQIEQLLDQRLAPVNELLQRVNQLDQQSAQQLETQNAKTIEEFAANPEHIFFDRVRDGMADFLDMAAQRGQSMTMEEAYQRACMADPQVAQAYMKQQADKAAAGDQAALTAAQRAGASVHGTPAGGEGGMLTDDMSLREVLEAQMTGPGRI